MQVDALGRLHEGIGQKETHAAVTRKNSGSMIRMALIVGMVVLNQTL